MFLTFFSSAVENSPFDSDGFSMLSGSDSPNVSSALTVLAWVNSNLPSQSNRLMPIVEKWAIDPSPMDAARFSAYDAGNSGELENTSGYVGAVFDGRFVYFVPHVPYFEGIEPHAKVLRFDTRGGFGSPLSWSAYDAGNSGGLNDTKGFRGAVFDGRYVYFVPYFWNFSRHARVLRYDSLGDFSSPDSWSAYDAGNSGGLNGTRGYIGAVFDGRFVYFVPYKLGELPHAKVLRFDTHGGFESPLSWSAFDAGNVGGLNNTKGYAGVVFDGRFVYFVPLCDGSQSPYHAKVLRFDTRGGFESPLSWSAFDAGNVGGLNNTKGYAGAVFDGRFVYFVPLCDGSSSPYHGKVLRFDTQGSFDSPLSWSAYDAGNSGGLNGTKGYYGAVFDGRFVYFVPYYDGNAQHGKVLRYDTSGDFNYSGSWTAYDASKTGGIDARGYRGAIFDGRFVYFSPYQDGFKRHAKVLRYDTYGAFDSPESWNAFDAGNTNNLNTKGYFGAVFDGRFAYFVPYYDAITPYHARVLRYDTTMGKSAYSLRFSQNGQAAGFGGALTGVTGMIDTDNGHFVVSDFGNVSAGRHHLALTYNGRELSLYVDGELKKSILATGAILNARDITVGGAGNGRLNVLIDTVAVYNRSLPGEEIRRDYEFGRLD